MQNRMSMRLIERRRLFMLSVVLIWVSAIQGCKTSSQKRVDIHHDAFVLSNLVHDMTYVHNNELKVSNNDLQLLESHALEKGFVMIIQNLGSSSAVESRSICFLHQKVLVEKKESDLIYELWPRFRKVPRD